MAPMARQVTEAETKTTEYIDPDGNSWPDNSIRQEWDNELPNTDTRCHDCGKQVGWVWEIREDNYGRESEGPIFNTDTYRLDNGDLSCVDCLPQ